MPEKIPTVSEVVLWIAKLGGFLGRKSDGKPGVTVLWRGWHKGYFIPLPFFTMLEMPGQPTNDYRTITQNLWVIVRPKGEGSPARRF